MNQPDILDVRKFVDWYSYASDGNNKGGKKTSVELSLDLKASMFSEQQVYPLYPEKMSCGYPSSSF